MGLAAVTSVTHAACVGTQTGDLAPMEELSFRDPATALPQLAAQITSDEDMPPTRRAALHAIAADASRDGLTLAILPILTERYVVKVPIGWPRHEIFARSLLPRGGSADYSRL